MTTKESMAVYAMIAAGGAVGFLAGLLAAPYSGRETRRRLVRRIEDEKDELARHGRKMVRRVGERIEEGFEDGKRVLTRAIS